MQINRRLTMVLLVASLSAASRVRADEPSGERTAPSGLHVGLGLGRAAALAGSGTNSTDWAWAGSVELDYQIARAYFGAVAMESYGEHWDQSLDTVLETRALALRAGGLWSVGPLDLFAGAGGGYLWQQFATNLAGPEANSGPVSTVAGVGALAEAGAIVWRGESYFQVSVVGRVVVPLFRHSDPTINQRFPVGIFLVRALF